MGTLKQWMGWIIFDGIIPTAALLVLAQHMRQNEMIYYVVGLPPLFVYFYILGRLGLDIPGTITEVKPDDEEYRSTISNFSLTTRHRLAKALGWLRIFGILFCLPVIGVTLILYAVRDGEAVGYLMGSAVIWVSGGFWAMLVQFLRKGRDSSRGREAAEII